MHRRIPNLAVCALAFAAATGAACADESNPCPAPAFEVQVLQEAHRSVDVPLDPKAFDGPDAHPGEIPMSRIFVPVPGHADLCVYAAAWIAIKPGPRPSGQYEDGRVRLYVATYRRDSGEKRSEVAQDVEVENLQQWAPTVQVDPAAFDLHDGVVGFALRLATEIRAITTSGIEQQFRLFADDGHGRLLNPFTYADADYPGLDPDRPANELAEMLYIVDKAAHDGWHDILQQPTVRTLKADGTPGPRKKLRRFRYRWDGSQYQRVVDAHGTPQP